MTERSAFHSWLGLVPPETFRDPPLVLQVEGDLACFTRPEFNSERVSYPVMTPTAAQGLLSAVFWKPQFRWVIDRIEVLAPVRWTTLQRNESAEAITRGIAAQGYLDLDKPKVTQQRITTLLRDVCYRIHAHVWVHPEADEQDPAKWREQFTRRMDRGQTFRTPYLGMREFHADVYRPDGRPAFDLTEDLGLMLHTIDTNWRTGKETYSWFAATVERGTVSIPRTGIDISQGGA